MKLLFSLALIIFSYGALSYNPQAYYRPCSALGEYLMQTPYGYQCGSYYQQNMANCIVCQQQYMMQMQSMYPQVPQNFAYWNLNQPSPWWGYQGQMMYPNFNYPGAWNYPGMNNHYYPGNNQIYMAKPNVYVNNPDGKMKPFKMEFPQGGEFLVTTPVLENDKSWEGLVTAKGFRVDNVAYDYLFYDARVDDKKLQFEHGYCTEGQHVVDYMLNEVNGVGFSVAAQKDFKEHWEQKIPSYSYYCVYPQYNKQLEAALPVKITPENTPFLRLVFVLVPYQRPPRHMASAYPALPKKYHGAIRPAKVDKSKFALMEWGVAFMDSQAIKHPEGSQD